MSLSYPFNGKSCFYIAQNRQGRSVFNNQGKNRFYIEHNPLQLNVYIDICRKTAFVLLKTTVKHKGLLIVVTNIMIKLKED